MKKGRGRRKYLFADLIPTGETFSIFRIETDDCSIGNIQR